MHLGETWIQYAGKGLMLVKWLRKMKTAPRLVAVFVIVAAIAAAIGAYGWRSLQRTNEETVQLAENYSNVQVHLSGVINAIQEQRTLLSKMILLEEQDAAGELQRQIADSDAVGLESLASYEKTCSTEVQLRKAAAISSAMEQCRVMREEAMAYAVQGDFEASRESWLRAESATAYALELLDTAVDSRAEEAVRLRTAQAADSRNTRVILLCMMGIGAGVAALLVYLLAASITGPMRALAAVAGRAAKGNMNTSCAFIAGKDEAGQLAVTLEEIFAVVRALEKDTTHLAASAAKGDLQTRADEAAYQGVYRRIARGVNSMLDETAAPMQASMQALGELARGNMNARMECWGSNAAMANALNGAVRMLRSYTLEMRHCLAAMAAGDFTQEIHTEFAGDFAELRHAINSMARQCNDVTRQIAGAAEQMSGSARRLSGGAQNISQGAMQQAEALRQMAAGAAKMAEQARGSAENAMRTNGHIGKAKEGGAKSAKSMARMQSAMQQLHEACAGISRITNRMEGFASQTGSLSLNAVMEAVHTDADGEGFALVAAEMRNLAEKNARTAKEAATLITTAMEKAAAGMEMADGASDSLRTILDSVEQALRAMNQIAETSREQTTGLMHINQELARMSRTARSNSAAAEEIAVAIEQLSDQAESLKRLVNILRMRGVPLQPQGGAASWEARNSGRESGRVRDRRTSSGATLHLLTEEDLLPPDENDGRESIIVLSEDEFEEY